MPNNKFNLKEVVKEFRESNLEVVKRLELIIYLLLKKGEHEGQITKREIIKELSEWGLKDYEIANILGRSRNYVAKEISQLKKSKKKQKESK